MRACSVRNRVCLGATLAALCAIVSTASACGWECTIILPLMPLSELPGAINYPYAWNESVCLSQGVYLNDPPVSVVNISTPYPMYSCGAVLDGGTSGVTLVVPDDSRLVFTEVQFTRCSIEVYGFWAAQVAAYSHVPSFEVHPTGQLWIFFSELYNVSVIECQSRTFCEVDHTTFTNATSAGVGGCIVARNATLTVKSSLFESNSAVGGGGAIACLGGSSCEFRGNRFYGNSAGGIGGGAVVAADSEVSIDFDHFEGNTATLTTECVGTNHSALPRGGALHFKACIVELQGIRMHNNTACLDGAAFIDPYPQPLLPCFIVDTSIMSNTARRAGAGGLTIVGNATIAGSNITNNFLLGPIDEPRRAGGLVAGQYFANQSLDMSGTTFCSNWPTDTACLQLEGGVCRMVGVDCEQLGCCPGCSEFEGCACECRVTTASVETSTVASPFIILTHDWRRAWVAGVAVGVGVVVGAGAAFVVMLMRRSPTATREQLDSDDGRDSDVSVESSSSGSSEEALPLNPRDVSVHYGGADIERGKVN